MTLSKAHVLGAMLLGLVSAGCDGGGDGSGPGPANVSGRWGGRLSSSGGSGNLTMVLNDAGGTVTGTRTYQQTGYVSAYAPAQSAKTCAVSGTYDPGSGTLILSYQAPNSIFISQDHYTVTTDGTMTLSENSLSTVDGGIANAAPVTSTLQRQD